jgi:hypothetical protein
VAIIAFKRKLYAADKAKSRGWLFFMQERMNEAKVPAPILAG